MTEFFYWRAKLVKGGPDIGVKTWRGMPVIDGEEQDRSHRWNCLVRNETTSRLILYGEPCPIDIEGISLRNLERIDKADYDFLTSHSQWATNNARHLPDAAPTQAIDWNKRRPIF